MAPGTPLKPEDNMRRVTELLDGLMSYHNNQARTHTYLHHFGVLARALWGLIDVSLDSAYSVLSLIDILFCLRQVPILGMIFHPSSWIL